QAEDGIRDPLVTGVQTCALPIWAGTGRRAFVGRGGGLSIWGATHESRQSASRPLGAAGRRSQASVDVAVKRLRVVENDPAAARRSEERRVGKGGGDKRWGG